MNYETFLGLDDTAVAAALQTSAAPCWAIAMGGTRRAYIAAGGVLAGPDDLMSYLQWADAAHRGVLTHLLRFGTQTVIAVEHVPRDRGPAYRAMLREGLMLLATGQERRAFYAHHNLRVRVVGDLEAIADALGAPDLVGQFFQLHADTAANGGPQLVYLLRGSGSVVGVEEAQLGYTLGQALRRPPTHTELVRAYYGMAVPPLSVYIGSGRPSLGSFRPPFLGGAEDLYWSQSPVMMLRAEDWRRIIFDHLWSRRTEQAREYAMDGTARRALTTALAAAEGQIIGVGVQHALGFWTAAPPAPLEREANG